MIMIQAVMSASYFHSILCCPSCSRTVRVANLGLSERQMDYTLEMMRSCCMRIKQLHDLTTHGSSLSSFLLKSRDIVSPYPYGQDNRSAQQKSMECLFPSQRTTTSVGSFVKQ